MPDDFVPGEETYEAAAVIDREVEELIGIHKLDGVEEVVGRRDAGQVAEWRHRISGRQAVPLVAGRARHITQVQDTDWVSGSSDDERSLPLAKDVLFHEALQCNAGGNLLFPFDPHCLGNRRTGKLIPLQEGAFF
jgi:hypothetical protein